MRKSIFIVLPVLTFFWIVFSYGYYAKINTQVSSDIGSGVQDTERAIISYSALEKNFDLKDGVAKGIYWARRAPSEKPFFYSICYLHGFSASRKELSPVIELVGDKLGAPVVFTRLEGHGIKDNKDFTKASVPGWYKDAVECFEVASRIGEKVIMIGTSTGAALASLVAAHHKEPHQMILLSPNFGINNKFFPLLSGPFGPLVARLYFGKEREIPHIYNEDFRYFWTSKYPSSALSILADLLRNIDKESFKRIKAPTLILTTPKDKIIDLEKVKEFALLKREGETVWESKEDFKNHNLAGDIVDPSKNELLIEIISDFITKH